jgi:flagellar hook-length control protein FliK
MRVALEADRLGTVEVQAKVTNDQIRAAIAVDRHDTHAVLASDLSALHQALNDRQPGAAHVTLFQGSLSSNDAFGNGTLAGHKEASPQANENTPWAAGEPSPTAGRGAELTLTNNIFDSNGRLSVRA